MVTSDRERAMRELAKRLLFDINEREGRCTLTRTVDVPAPVQREDLTLSQAEEVLETWKLRGAHGG